jgi:hypothetical protein
MSSSQPVNADHRDSFEGTEDVLLGDRPPWILGAALIVLGAVFGIGSSLLILLSDANEVVHVKVRLEAGAAPFAVHSAADGRVKYRAVGYVDETTVRHLRVKQSVRVVAPSTGMRQTFSGSVEHVALLPVSAGYRLRVSLTPIVTVRQEDLAQLAGMDLDAAISIRHKSLPERTLGTLKRFAGANTPLS